MFLHLHLLTPAQDVMRKYKASVSAVTTDQITIQDQAGSIQTLEAERNKLREQVGANKHFRTVTTMSHHLTPPHTTSHHDPPCHVDDFSVLRSAKGWTTWRARMSALLR